MTPTKLHKERCGKQSNLEVLADERKWGVEPVCLTCGKERDDA